MLARNIPQYGFGGLCKFDRLLQVDEHTDLNSIEKKHSWLSEEKLVVKPDQLFGRRLKNRLLLLGERYDRVKEFLKENMGREVAIEGRNGALTHFLVEPFVDHKMEYYLALRTEQDSDVLHFSTEGGIDIEEHWESVRRIEIPVLRSVKDTDLEILFSDLQKNERELLCRLVKTLHQAFIDLDFTFLEFNPFTIKNEEVIPLDCRVKLDDASAFENLVNWGNIEFPAPFGSEVKPEERFIESLDEGTGASLKLKILNPQGKIWTMVAGGGASVIYADTVCDLGFQKELANYGEYSGNPNEEETYQYARTILDLMTREETRRYDGKILLIGGGIANFTDVAETFKGIARALRDYSDRLRESNVGIYVRRGGPNYQKGLQMMRELGNTLEIPISVYGPQTHMTRIVSMAVSGEGSKS